MARLFMAQSAKAKHLMVIQVDIDINCTQLTR